MLPLGARGASGPVPPHGPAQKPAGFPGARRILGRGGVFSHAEPSLLVFPRWQQAQEIFTQIPFGSLFHEARYHS